MSRTRKAADAAASAAAQLQQRCRTLLLRRASSWSQEIANRRSNLSPPPALSSFIGGSSAARQIWSRAIADGRGEILAPLKSQYICLRCGGGLLANCGRSHFEFPASAVAVQQVRRLKISGSEVKVGFVIERKGRIEKILKTQHTTQGRGGASIQVELRDVQTGLKSGARLRTSEAIEKVFVDERPFTFLYLEDQTAHLMDPTTFDQMGIPKTYFDTGGVYLKDGMDVTVHYFDGKPLSASVPARVTCTVAEAEPYAKGQTATPTYKRVLLDNGVQIMTPSFISAGDDVVVDTTDDSYVTRSK